MREILFRGKRVDNGEWVYGSFIPDLREVFYGDTGLDGFIKPYGKTKEERLMTEVLRETVVQYTGLTDKNGKKIFEGDIVNGKNAIHGYYEKFIVVWDDEAAGFYCKRCRNTDCNYCFDLVLDIKIIGNIHDNPELLEES